MRYQIGITEVDKQHAELFRAFARLKLSQSGEALSDALSLIDGLIRHHFITEEREMRSLNLPDELYCPHVAAHHLILEELAELHWRAMFGDAWTMDEMLALVAEWIVRHLAEFDLAIKPFVDNAAFNE